MTINYEEETEVTSEQLAEVSKLAKQQQDLEDLVDKKTAELKEAKKQLYNIQEQALPDLMQEIGLQMFRLSDGSTIEVNEKLYASISQKNKPEAIKWLNDHDLSSLIKNDIIVPFDKGQGEEVQGLLDLLKSSGFKTVQLNENINTGSVKSTINELLEQGEEAPLELFGAYFARKAVITS